MIYRKQPGHWSIWLNIYIVMFILGFVKHKIHSFFILWQDTALLHILQKRRCQGDHHGKYTGMEKHSGIVSARGAPPRFRP